MITKAERKLIRSLRQKKFRDQERLFVVEGVKMVLEALESKERIRGVYVLSEGLFPWLTDAKLITTREMAEISQFSTPSPTLALVEQPEIDLLQTISTIDKSLLYLGLDSIKDPGNLGTILRIADWFGIKAIFASVDTVDLYNAKVIQASMGAIFRVPLYYVDLMEIIDTLDIPIWGTALSGSSIYETQLSPNGLIIIGNEANGITPTLLQKIDHKLVIPPFYIDSHGSESLNAAISTAIVCSEFRRRYLNK